MIVDQVINSYISLFLPINGENKDMTVDQKKPEWAFPSDKTPYEYQKQCFDIIDTFSDPKFKYRGITVKAPTSKGKTMIAKKAMAWAKKNKMKYIYTCPIKALANEIATEKIVDCFSPLILNGDFKENKKKVSDPKYDGFVCTTHMLFQYVMFPLKRRIFHNVGVVIVDEAHQVGDENSGHIVEGFLIMLQKFVPHIKVVLLSATIGN